MSGLRPLQSRPDPVRGTSHPAVGEQVSTAALLAGCVMEPWFGDVHTATIEVLRRAGYQVVVPESQTCCGALAAHDGDAGDALRLAQRNLAAFAGVDVVVVNAAGCGAHLKDYEHWTEGGDELAGRVQDVTEVVAAAIAAGRLPTFAAGEVEVAIQDPCHLRHAQRITDDPRAVVRAAGYRPVEIDPDGMCCGAAGIYSVLRPQTSAELGSQKADQVRAVGTRLVASANPGCEMQLRTHLGSDYRVAHPVELYWEALQHLG